MGKSAGVSAGLLMFRRAAGGVEVFLVHPGGPFWSRRDAGVWTIPKGLVGEDADLLEEACREFREETGFEPLGPFLPLGSIQQKAGKTVHAWAFEGDADPQKLKSNTIRIEWPHGSGKWITIPEVDRGEWFDMTAAAEKMNPAQAEYLARLTQSLSSEAQPRSSR